MRHSSRPDQQWRGGYWYDVGSIYSRRTDDCRQSVEGRIKKHDRADARVSPAVTYRQDFKGRSPSPCRAEGHENARLWTSLILGGFCDRRRWIVIGGQ